MMHLSTNKSKDQNTEREKRGRENKKKDIMATFVNSKERGQKTCST
jgi:hypothetical protein